MPKKAKTSVSLLEQARNNPKYQTLSREHPIQGKLVERALEKFDQAVATVESRPPGWEEVFHQSASEFREILTWVTEPTTPDSLEKVIQDAEKMVREQGLSFDLAQDYVKSFSPSRGSPITRLRPLATEALEMQLKGSKLSWQQLAIKLDYCRDDKEVKSSAFICRERLRTQVATLKKFLKKHNIALS